MAKRCQEEYEDVSEVLHPSTLSTLYMYVPWPYHSTLTFQFVQATDRQTDKQTDTVEYTDLPHTHYTQ